jgi:hypothetical protein
VVTSEETAEEEESTSTGDSKTDAGKGVVTSEGNGGTSGGSVAGSKHKRGRNCRIINI